MLVASRVINQAGILGVSEDAEVCRLDRTSAAGNQDHIFHVEHRGMQCKSIDQFTERSAITIHFVLGPISKTPNPKLSTTTYGGISHSPSHRASSRVVKFN